MKFTSILFLCALVASVSAIPSFLEEKECSDPWEVIHAGDDKLAGEYFRNVIEQINSLSQREIDDQCVEILLVCGKKPGCVFDVTGQAITLRRHFKIRGELKHGERPVVFNQGTPIIIDSDSPLRRFDEDVQISDATDLRIVRRAGRKLRKICKIKCSKKRKCPRFCFEEFDLLSNAAHFQKINLIADPNLPGDSRIVIRRGNVYLEEMLIKGHNSGITGLGGALVYEGDGLKYRDQKIGDVRIETVSFISNGAERGGALAILGSNAEANIAVINSHFEDNVATEKGGAVYLDLADIEIDGCTFKGNRATGSSMNIGEGGALWFLNPVGTEIFNTRSLGGNYAKFGQFLYYAADKRIRDRDSKRIRFICRRSADAAVCESDAERREFGEVEMKHFVGIDDLESIYLENLGDDDRDGPRLELNASKLRRGIICADNELDEFVSRYDFDSTDPCGSDIQLGAYCTKGKRDDPVKEDDEDEDGVSCVYDCDDHDPDVRPGVGEVGNDTDSNCNGLADEWIDTDGDLTPDGYDACPEDSNKIAPGVCGCGLIDQSDYNGCVTCVAADYGYGTAQTYKEAPNKDPVYADGYWYILDDADWWWWDGSSWAYGGAY